MNRHIRADWETALLVCRKCSKKLDGGFGLKGKTPLAKALKKELGAKGGRKSKIGIVEVKCLGICPKHAVTLIDARKSRDWLIVKQGTDAGELVAELGLKG
ncbi:(2Fe-2S) ferredoxin domain-containing protein [Sphingobium boeckii]|uniref:Putative metal-binding protein n=1 Tax=Sphingobium boeckii TaxID=1082345 RepID=A0A7W9AK75_9SPHN|nr:(2Fe-2S) ferredoxin domain-containing protein [Sphingobium boeckii]MBB5687165.1 putative metal-binding protein [Sphingobium boeckii]